MSIYTHCCAMCNEMEHDYCYAQAIQDFWMCERCRDKLRSILGVKMEYGCEEYQEETRKEIGKNLEKLIRNGVSG